MSGVLLHLLRHGTPELAGRLLGRHDCGSTEQGIAVCRAQAAGLEVVRLISSPLRRARMAADAIGSDVGLLIEIDERWQELDFGRWDALSADEIAATDRAALHAFWDDPDANPPPGGERWAALRARVGEAVAAIDAPALVVTHGGAMRAALSLLCGLDQRQSWCLDLPYGALLSLRRHGDAAQVVGLRLP